MSATRFVPVLLFLFLQSALAQAPAGLARGDTVSWTVQPQDVPKRTGHTTLTVNGTVAAGWHVYSLKQLPEGPTPLLVTVVANEVAAANGAAASSAPAKIHDPAFDLDTQSYTGTFALTVPVRFKLHPGSGPQTIPIDVRFQTCNGRFCQPPKTVRLYATLSLQG